MLYNRKKASGTLYEKLRARQRKNVLKKQLNQPMENNIDGKTNFFERKFRKKFLNNIFFIKYRDIFN